MTTHTRSKPTYHHGDLKRVLTEVALDLVRSRQTSTFSLREAARGAGVTSAAVYKHFADREALLAAIARAGFDMMAERVAVAVRHRKGEARLIAVGDAYIAFAVAEPDLFRLMFKTARLALASPPVREMNSDRPKGAFEHLHEAVAGAAGVAAGDVDQGVLGLAWSVAHGAACLIIDGVWQANDQRAKEAIRLAVPAIVKHAGNGDGREK